METIPAKQIIAKTKYAAGWFGNDYNMNIYRGCTHGCIYCDSRSDCYQNPDFEAVKVKANALATIRADLRSKKLSGVVGTGAMSDPYNPFEETACLTRSSLDLLRDAGFGVSIATKSPLVTRDIDKLLAIQQQSPVLVQISITCADDALSKLIEPHVAVSSARFDALRQLSQAGIFCGVLMMPILPFINDTIDNVTAIVHKAAAAGAHFIYPAMGMTLRQGNREYFYQQLDAHFPTIQQRYIATFGDSYTCDSPHAAALWAQFSKTCQQYRLLYHMRDIIAASRKAYTQEQQSLF